MLRIEHNKVCVDFCEPISLMYPVSGTLLETYTEVTMNLRGKEFSEDIPLEIDTENNTLKLYYADDLPVGSYYYTVTGLSTDGHKRTFTRHPLYLEVLPCL